MRPETSEASAKAGPGVLLGGVPGSYSEYLAKTQVFAVPIGELIPPIIARALVAMAAGKGGSA
jgi:hypothetical protein